MAEITMVKVVSSNLHSVGYDKDSMIFRVKFNSGTVYDYINVPLSIFNSFMSSNSKGTFLNDKIKGKYNYRQIQ